jgi:hypothetical protein
MFFLRRLGLLALACSACTSGSSRAPQPASDASNDAPYTTESCPIPAGVVGYPFTVVALDSAAVDSTWLRSWTLAAVHRWQVPSFRRNWIVAWRNATDRIIPRHPRWADDDWRPTRRDRAEMLVTLDGLSAPEHRVRTASGDALFDRSLETIFTDPMPASPEFPPLDHAGPVTLLIRFGGEPAPGERSATIRFARQQRPVRVVPRSFYVSGQENDRATIEYDVSASGDVVPGSLEMLDVTRGQFKDALRYSLYQAHFFPAQSECEPIALSVVQQFGR